MGIFNVKLDSDELNERIAEEEIQVDHKVIKSYVTDLHALLGQGTIIEQRAFIKAFVNSVVYEHPNITVEYTITFDTKKADSPDGGVLPTVRNGSVFGIRILPAMRFAFSRPSLTKR